jgi:hypothetical protein
LKEIKLFDMNSRLWKCERAVKVNFNMFYHKFTDASEEHHAFVAFTPVFIG